MYWMALTMNNNDEHPKPTYFYQTKPESNRLSESSFLVRHPSRDVSPEFEVKENPYFVKHINLPPETSVAIECRYMSFKKTENPVYVIEAFLIAHKENLYPPFWVLDHIAGAFEQYHKLQGTKPLDEVFKLKVGKGQTPLFKSLSEDERDQMLCQHVHNLCVLFKISIDESCFMVSRYFEEEDLNKTLFDMKDISEDTIKDKYIKKWKKIFNVDIYKERILSCNEQDNKAYIQGFLDKLPEDDSRYLKDKYTL